MNSYTFEYSLRCYLPPKTVQERKQELMQIPDAYKSAFLELIVAGYSIDKAKELCGIFTELIHRHGITCMAIIRIMKQFDQGLKVGVKLKELDLSDLN